MFEKNNYEKYIKQRQPTIPREEIIRKAYKPVDINVKADQLTNNIVAVQGAVDDIKCMEKCCLKFILTDTEAIANSLLTTDIKNDITRYVGSHNKIGSKFNLRLLCQLINSKSMSMFFRSYFDCTEVLISIYIHRNILQKIFKIITELTRSYIRLFNIIT